MTMRQINYIIVAVLSFIVYSFYTATAGIRYPANIYPKAVIYVLGALTLMLLIRTLFFPKLVPDIKPFANTKKLRVIGVGLSIIIYIVATKQLGFYFTSGIFMFLFSWFFGGLSRKPKDILTAAGVSAVVLMLIYAAFSIFLRVPTPTGIFI